MQKWGVPTGVRIRRAQASDAAAIMRLVQGLAEFEREPDAVKTTEELLIRDGFGEEPLFYVLLAERDTGDGNFREVRVGYNEGCSGAEARPSLCFFIRLAVDSVLECKGAWHLVSERCSD
jgi:hypothetical protein